MALDARTRSSIYEKLRPVLGDADANALMSEFPTYEADELVTRSILRAETAELRAEMHTGFAEVRAEMHTEFGAVRAEMHDLGRRMTMWVVATMLTGMALAAAIARAGA